LPNVHLLDCVYKSRKRKKETSFNWEMIKQQNTKPIIKLWVFFLFIYFRE
jgi:hypothetical protein